MEASVLTVPRLAAPRAARWVYTVTLFLSAGLMFLVEPMIAKILLPRLGGSPAVWTTCLVFFQATLLVGYAYAHALTALFTRPQQIFIHLFFVLPLAAFSLPVHVAAGTPAHGEWPAAWLLVQLVLALGPAVFAISATAPLLQSWFAGLDRKAVGDPYILYAASNAGSLLALLAYPFLVEPNLPLDRQAFLWSWGFAALTIGIAVSAAVFVFQGTISQPATTHQRAPAGSFRERLRWCALAFVPSSLLLGATTHVTTDIASAPLLWVFPLGLYLLSFVFAFAERPLLRHDVMMRAMALLIIPVALTTTVPAYFMPLPLLLAFHFGCLFAVCMVCHGELFRSRPPAERLTEFYFFLSAGGVLGGIFNALLAPVIFHDVWEYPLALVAACLAMPTQKGARGGIAGDVGLPVALTALILAVRYWTPGTGEGGHIAIVPGVFALMIPALALLNFSDRRWRFALGVAGCLLAPAVVGSSDTIETARSFFGVYRVRAVTDGDAKYLVMMHGTTLHGVKSLAPGDASLPAAYYSPEGPFGRFFAALPSGSLRHVAVVGLGTGELGCYAKPRQDWTFYEIDPLVERMARDPRYFDFLSHCGNHPHVVLGDARLNLADAPDGSYDLLILDAFSSDTVPMHLMTREALALYLRKLAPNGLLLFHISSRTLDLAPVVGSLAADAGLTARLMGYSPAPGAKFLRTMAAELAVLARRPGALDFLARSHGWIDLRSGGARSLWTDQRSDLLRVIRY